MIGYWHVESPDAKRRIRSARGAELHGLTLVVEQCEDEDCWQWSVLSAHGHVIESGVEPSVRAAEERAEAAAFHVHPPMLGDWIERLI